MQHSVYAVTLFGWVLSDGVFGNFRHISPANNFHFETELKSPCLIGFKGKDALSPLGGEAELHSDVKKMLNHHTYRSACVTVLCFLKWGGNR